MAVIVTSPVSSARARLFPSGLNATPATVAPSASTLAPGRASPARSPATAGAATTSTATAVTASAARPIRERMLLAKPARTAAWTECRESMSVDASARPTATKAAAAPSKIHDLCAGSYRWLVRMCGPTIANTS